MTKRGKRRRMRKEKKGKKIRFSWYLDVFVRN